MNEASVPNRVGNPKFSRLNDQTIEGWTFVSPRPELAPGYSYVESTESCLVLSGTGDKHAFGCWRGEAKLEIGKWYKASVMVRLQDIAQPALSVFAQVAKHVLVPKGPWGKQVVLEQVFRHGKEYDGNHIEFYFRASSAGRTEWFNPVVVEIPAPKHRMVRVATIRFGTPPEPLTMDAQQLRISDKLDQAGAMKPDIAVLTEFCSLVGVSLGENPSYWELAEKVPDGPTCRILAAAARQYQMYVLAGIIERRGKYLFNTAVLFDRRGELIGRYDKTHLTFYELTKGFSCGDSYPVFDVDFGRIGIHICYDEWFPEVSRHYAHQGVEILFLPVMGGKPMTWRTRALDNGLYFVSSSLNPPSMIIDSSGAIIAETHGDGIACADLNLDFRRTNVYGDPTLSYGMPGIFSQMRNVVDDRMLNELMGLMQSGKPGHRPII